MNIYPKETKRYVYTRPWFHNYEDLPRFVFQMRDNCGFNFSLKQFKVWNKKENSYRLINRPLDSFLLYRHLKQDMSVALPLHPNGNLFIFTIGANDAFDAMRVYYDMVRLLRKAPHFMESDDAGNIRVFYKIKEFVDIESLDKFRSHLLKKTPAEGVDFSFITPRDSDLWVDVPGSIVWKTQLSPNPYCRKEYDGGFTPIERKGDVGRLMAQDPISMPEILKFFKSDSLSIKREPVPFMPSGRSYAYGRGTRHAVQPGLALYCINKYGFDFKSFRQECFINNTGGSRDMANPVVAERVMRSIWGWAIRVHNPAHCIRDNTIIMGSKDNIISREIASSEYEPRRRVRKTGRVYNPVIMEEEEVTWWYNNTFHFNPTLRGKLYNTILFIVQKYSMSKTLPGTHTLVRNAIRLYELLYEQSIWNSKIRQNKNFDSSVPAHIAPLQEGVVFSKEMRRKICGLFGISQHNKIWRILRWLELVTPLRDTNGFTYSWKGDWHYAQHFKTPGDKLDRYVDELFAEVQSYKTGLPLSNSKLISANTITIINNNTIRKFSFSFFSSFNFINHPTHKLCGKWNDAASRYIETVNQPP